MRKIYEVINGKKICTGCHENLPENEFGWIFKKNGKHIQKSKCKQCLQQQTEYWRDNHREKYLGARKQYRENNKARLRVASYRQGAVYRGLVCELTSEQFIALFNQPCDYCGDQDALNGVDRIDNSQGYIPGNVVPCCSVCNTMKKKMTKDEFLLGVNKITLHQASLNRREHHA